jgi:hypothetical protein
MRTISHTLRAASLALHGHAVVRATVRDTRLRWREHVPGSGAAAENTAMLCAETDTGAVIIRVRCTATGQVQVARVTDPANPAQWTAWHTAQSGAIAHSDVAVAAPGEGRLRIVYVRSEGGGFRVSTIESADGGATWFTAGDVAGGLTTPAHVAAAGAVCYVLDTTLRTWLRSASSGAWAGPYHAPWSPGQPAGLAAAHDHASPDMQRLLLCGDGRVWAMSFTPGVAAWSPAVSVDPGGDGGPTALSAPYDPALCALPDRTLLTWVEHVAGAPYTRATPVLRVTHDWTHFGSEVSLPLAAAAHKRVALAWLPGEGAVYAANLDHVVRAQATPRALELPAVRAYHYEAGGSGRVGTLRLDAGFLPAHHPEGGDVMGMTDSTLQPFAAIHIERGYRTAGDGLVAVDETLALPPLYLVEARHSVGRGAGRLSLRAVDGMGLLDMWRPRDVLTWHERPILWLLGELCARVGLPATPLGDEGANRVLPAFSLHPGQTARQGAEALLRLAGAVARFDDTGRMVVMSWPTPPPPARLEVGAWGEIAAGGWGLRAPAATSLYLVGREHTVHGHHAAAMALGLDLARTLEDRRITSRAAAEAVLARELALGAGGRRESVTVPLRPEAELWDPVALHGAARAVLALVEEYDAAAGRYTTTLELGE